MSDQLSKVVAEMREQADKVKFPAKLRNWADQIESAAHLPNPGEIGSKSVDAAAPVEVELPDPSLHYHDGVGLVPAYTAEQVATLARQLAESKAESEETANNLNTMIVYWREAAEQAESALAAANAELSNLRIGNIAYASDVSNLRGRAGLAEQQLAAATRRVAEVEGAGRRLRLDYVRMLETARDRIRDLGGECDPVDVMERADPALLAFDAALQKEPK